MMQLENKYLKIEVNPVGAELQSIFSKDTELEYLWSGDPAFWGKKSPVLFPIVGGLKNNSYTYQGNSYQLNRHGFAREKDFLLTANEANSMSFTLDADAATQEQYPFLFRFVITYALQQNKLSCTYDIINIDIKPMYFSVGAHPAFKVPLVADTVFEDYYLLFEKEETVGKWPLSEEGLIENTPVDFFNNSNRINLTKELFYGDALVFKQLQSKSISILSEKTKHGLKFEYSDFPYIGIWSAKNADFICIEPWCGIADSVDTEGDFAKKEGIQLLIPGERFSRTWSVELI